MKVPKEAKKFFDNFYYTYFIDNKGIVYYTDKLSDKVFLKSQRIKQRGYSFVRISDFVSEKKIEFLIHRIVAEHFCLGKTEERCHVNHIDRNRLNNNYTNLEWCTNKENALHTFNTKLDFKPFAKKPVNVFKDNVFYKYFPTSTQASKELKVDIHVISQQLPNKKNFSFQFL